MILRNLLRFPLLVIFSIPIDASARQAPAHDNNLGIPVSFTLPYAGYVTLVIDDNKGNRVANIIGETYFPAGSHTLRWNGYDLGHKDDKGNWLRKRVDTGTYFIRGLYHKKITMRYEFSVGSPGTPPWKTLDGSGAWLADHSPPADILCLPEENDTTLKNGHARFLVCSTSGESGEEFVWLNKDGRRLYGMNTGFWGGHIFAWIPARMHCKTYMRMFLCQGKEIMTTTIWK